MPKLAANISMLFTEQPFLKRFALAARCGFRAVECLFPYSEDPRALKAALERSELQQALFNAPPGDFEAGERGIGALPGREDEFKFSIEQALTYAELTKCARLHVMAGLTSGGAREDVFVPNLRWAADAAASVGVTVCVEALNPTDFPGYLVGDTATAARLVAEVGHSRCAHQFDLYHHAMTEGSGAALLEAAVREYAPAAAHVQIANPPARNEPGVGDVDFHPLLELLDEVGYKGHIGCEYKPSTTTMASLGWAERYGVSAAEEVGG